MNLKFPKNLSQYIAEKNTVKNQEFQPLNMDVYADRVTASGMLDMELEPLVKAYYPDGRDTTFNQRAMMRCLQSCAIQLLDMDDSLSVDSLK